MFACNRACVSGVDLEIASLFGSLSKSRSRKQSTDQREEQSWEPIHFFLRSKNRKVEMRGYGLWAMFVKTGGEDNRRAGSGKAINFGLQLQKHDRSSERPSVMCAVGIAP